MKLTLSALTLAVATAIAAPAVAGPTITFGYVAKNHDEAVLMRGGMAAWTLLRDHEKNGKITHNGVGAALNLFHNGGAIVEQHGNGHKANVGVSGKSACTLVQTGNGATNNVYASGGKTCVVWGIGLK